MPAPYTLAVLIAVITIKVVLSRYVKGVGTEIESTAVKADAWHYLSDAITSGFAFIGITIGLMRRNPTSDDWAALCASPIILFNGLRQMRSPVAELLDTIPRVDMEHAVREVAKTIPGVVGLEKYFVGKWVSTTMLIYTSWWTVEPQ